MSMSGSILRTRRSYPPVVVIKTGGSLIESLESTALLAEDISEMSSDFRFVVVNGGGKEIDRLCRALSIPVEKIEGLRVTTPDVLSVVQMALAKSSNAVASLLHSYGVNALPLPAFAGGTVVVEKRVSSTGRELGLVGRVVAVDCTLIRDLQRNGIVPVIYPVASDRNYNLCNVNADEIASALAAAMKADSLLMMTDVEGVLVEGSPRGLLKLPELEELGKKGCFSDGMLPKLEAASNAVWNGVSRVCIMDGRRKGSVIEYLREGKLNGTEIQK